MEKLTFFHRDLKEEIYMQQPCGFEVKGKEDLVCKLKRSLYGLKQASRQWYLKFDNLMTKQSYTRYHPNHYVYFQKLNDGVYVILLRYVDDILTKSNMQDINMLERK